MAAAEALLGDVLAAIDAGDAERVLAALETASEGQRRRLAPKLRTRAEALRPRLLDAARMAASPQRIAAATACVATASKRTIAGLLGVTGDPAAVVPDLAGRAVAPRGREFANELVDRLLDSDRRAAVFQARTWGVLRWLVRNGVADLPQDPRYIATMISAVGTTRWRDADRIYHGLIADPALLEHEVWRLFELDVVSELEQARVWDGPRHPRTARENAWIRALVRLAAEDRLDRTRLLDASLAALGRDFRSSMIAWHGELHEGLGPTPQERAERISGYAGLLGSSTPAVTRFTLAALSEIERQVPAEVLVRGAPGPLSLREKKYAFQMLGMIDRALARDGGAAAELLGAAAHGLAHARPDVQERTLELLERHTEVVTGSVEVRAAILAFAESVAPTLRDRLDDLVGFSAAQSATEPDHEPPLAMRLARVDPASHGAAPARKAVEEAASGCWPAPRTAPHPDSGPGVQPVSDVDELIEVAALCLEGDAPAAQLDRLLDAVSAVPAKPDEGVRRGAGAVAARARQVLATPRWPGVCAAEIAANAFCGWLDGKRQQLCADKHAVSTAPPPLTPRIDYYVDWRNAARRTAGDPVLVFDPAPEDAHPAARWLNELYAGPHSRGWKREVMWAADRGGARWLISRHPGRIDIFFALAATNAFVFRDDNIVYGFGEVVLEHALDSVVELGTVGWFAVASALMVKSSPVRRLAGDVTAATIADGRFDPQALAEAIGWLLREDAGNLRRATETLSDISRGSGVHAAQTLRLVEGLLPQVDPKVPGLHHPLELALQLATDLDLWVAGGDARAALSAVVEQTSRGSKTSRAAARLLGRPANAASMRAWQEASAGAVVAWASGLV